MRAMVLVSLLASNMSPTAISPTLGCASLGYGHTPSSAVRGFSRSRQPEPYPALPIPVPQHPHLATARQHKCAWQILSYGLEKPTSNYLDVALKDHFYLHKRRACASPALFPAVTPPLGWLPRPRRPALAGKELAGLGTRATGVTQGPGGIPVPLFSRDRLRSFCCSLPGCFRPPRCRRVRDALLQAE